MAYGDGVDIPVAYKKEDFDVFAQDPVKTDGAYTSIEFITSEKTGAVAFPGDATYAVHTHSPSARARPRADG